ncbi:Hypothetical protein CINCED_3A016363 [Cinara cedri]|uniref:Uncharacterized protein n=1 Tax=Cinara cedri TaxID=506608 RepID=A0A5E4N4M6_9HEMI|nr:Hypothetical protein CINCED_3A016363 [Cinara cedri]
MAEFVFCRHIFVIQLIFVAVGILTVEVDSNFLEDMASSAGSLIRTVSKAPSMILDGTQSLTTSAARALRQIKPVKPFVDVAAGSVTGVLGTASRILGKSVTEPPKVMFLYKRPIEKYGTSPVYRNAVNAVLGLALANIVYHNSEVQGNRVKKPEATPVLAKLEQRLLTLGVPKCDIDDIVKVLGCNGKIDAPKEIIPKVMGILKTPYGGYNKNGPIQEIRWIARHPKGFYELSDLEKTDYNLKVKGKYSNCAVLQLPDFFKSTNKKAGSPKNP